MTTIFSDGFESGDFNAWSTTYTGGSGVISVATTLAHHGSYAARTTVQANSDSARAIRYVTAASEVYMREYVCFESLPTAASLFGAGPRFARGTGLGTAIAYVIYDATQSKWGVRNSVLSVSYLENGTSTLQTGVWYCVELYVKIGSSTGAVKLWVNGILKVNQTNVNTGTNNIDNVSVNCYTNTNEPQSRTVYHDCSVVADTYIGPESTLVQVADSLGLNDSVLRDKTLSIIDSVGLVDISLRNWAPHVADSIGLTEFVEALKGAVIKYVEDHIDLNDIAEIMKNLQIADSVSLFDAAETPTRIIKALDETRLNDMAWLNKTLILTDQIALVEVVEKTVHGAVKTKLFLVVGDLAIQLTG